jgi:hypothetical protein
MLTFGVFAQALINSNEKLGLGRLVHNVFNKAFWPIFGDFTILEKYIYSNCSSGNGVDDVDEKKDCITSASHICVYIGLMVYIIFANVLLLNILIAIFK